ncbi:hypothetical protein LOTGIDRAFT_164376 [Lottia gigantea]|uniref:Uncharacterized protein n=1 Tax=Lottia gigantea TaxID=225164 RepID=V3ZFV2_LOTGI|nr:hypothetical protein LOTGIDRAFT_164376 [Lottia gigantea]ESO90073.1 hypothetical protein LOTGIDRAFT_164376 [Lottia gigantea]
MAGHVQNQNADAPQAEVPQINVPYPLHNKIQFGLLPDKVDLSVDRFKYKVSESKKCLSKSIHGRRELLTILSEERKALDKLASDVQICKISGGVAGTVGTGLVIGGFAASFFTFGTSLIVSGVGAGVGGFSTLVASGASIADFVISKREENLINKLLEKDEKCLEKIQHLFEDCNFLFHVLSRNKNAEQGNQTIGLVKNLIGFTRITDVAIVVGRSAYGLVRDAAKCMSILGVVFSIISLPIDFHTVVTNSMAKHKGDKHKISEELKNFEENIEKGLVSMEAMMAHLENTERAINAS